MTHSERDANAWLELRRMRASVPDGISGRDVGCFRASLEQAESYYEAAAVAGPATSAVLIYYGYVQLAKAIEIAAGVTITTSHGLACGRSGGGSILSLAIASEEGCGHLTGMQVAVGDDINPIPRGSKLRDLVRGHPDLHDLFLGETEARPARIVARSLTEETFGKPLPARDLQTWVSLAGPKRTRDDLVEIITGLPLPMTYEVGRDFRPFDEANPGRYGYGLELDWPRSQDADGVWAIPSVRDIPKWLPRGPAFDPSEAYIAPTSPAGTVWSRLSWWWPVLFAFGHVTRYAPEDWARAIDLDSMSTAADIHELLRRARSSLPVLGLWAIREAEARTSPISEHVTASSG